MRLKTTCERIIWSGFFGVNESGHQPECGAEIEIDVEEESVDRQGGSIRPCFSMECPKCHGTIEWPQEWEMVAEIQEKRKERSERLEEIVIKGGNYNWKHSPQDRLVYIGKKGSWHQFRKIGDPRDVWCEVLDEDLHMIEETKPHNEELTGRGPES